MDSKEYKLYHEEHMMFNNGTSVEECGILLSIIPFLVFLSLFITSYVATVLIPFMEFCIIILPIILFVTVLSEAIQISLLIAALMCVVILVKHLQLRDGRNIFYKRIEGGDQFVTNYRACTNFISAICILAVDFNIFPKKFAKTETFGFGLMDLGVGFFICSNGLVEKCKSSESRTLKVMKTSLTLFTLGTIRLVVTKAINYQEHITEYGTHWNFFFTLAFCRIIVFFIKSVMAEVNPLHLFLIVGSVHEVCLNLGLKDWILSDIPRNSFVAANREGLTSSLGFVSLYFAACSIRKYVFLSKNATYKDLVFKLFIICLLSWVGTYCCSEITGVSRRLANLGYNLWIISLSLTVLVLFLVLEPALATIKKKENIPFVAVPQIFQSVNSNALFFFLLSNLLTGLINCIFQTLLLGSFMSLTIIITYSAVLCKITYYLYVRKIHLKF